MKIPMIATKAHRSGGKVVQPGDLYEVDGMSQKRLHVGMGWGEDAPPPKVATVAAPLPEAEKPKRVPPFARKVVEPAPEANPPPAPATPAAEADDKPKRSHYRRRDLTAEE